VAGVTPAAVARSGRNAGRKDGLRDNRKLAIVSRQILDATGPGSVTTRLYAYAYERGFEAGEAERARRLQP